MEELGLGSEEGLVGFEELSGAVLGLVLAKEAIRFSIKDLW